MQGSAEEALILLETDGEMFFKPTAVNSLSKRHYGVRNLSRIALCFEWKMHSTDAEVLSIEPMTGVIQPNEKMVSRLAVNYGGLIALSRCRRKVIHVIFACAIPVYIIHVVT